MEPDKSQDTMFQTPQNMYKLECTFKVLRDGNTLFREKNTILHNKIIELKTKLTGARKNSSNSSPPAPHHLMLLKQKKCDKKCKVRVQPEHKQNFRKPFVPKQLDKIRNFAPEPKSTVAVES